MNFQLSSFTKTLVREWFKKSDSTIKMYESGKYGFGRSQEEVKTKHVKLA